jgi:hypothetical protein
MHCAEPEIFSGFPLFPAFSAEVRMENIKIWDIVSLPFIFLDLFLVQEVFFFPICCGLKEFCNFFAIIL